MKYEDKFEARKFEVDGTEETEWIWQKNDVGAWDGPLKDWNGSHSDKFIEFTPGMRVVVTAGGCHGMYVRPYSNLFEKVYAFEPDWLNFHAMVRNSLRDNVYCFRAALGAKPGMCELVPTPDPLNVGMHRVATTRGDDIPMMTIDMLSLQHCDLIQLDVEGHEHQVLLGAVDTIEKFSPTIVLEDANRNVIAYIIEELGYKEVGRSVADTIFIRDE